MTSFFTKRTFCGRRSQRALGAVLILWALSCFSLAAGADFVDPGYRGFAAKARALARPEHQDEFIHLIEMYKTKCTGIENCFLTEQDLLGPKARPDRVLLFRGENQVFEHPVVPASVRDAFDPAGLCGLHPCDREGLLNQLLERHILLGDWADDHLSEQNFLQDVFLSFTRDPKIAFVYGQGGQLFILSVPKEIIRKVKASDCDQPMVRMPLFYDLYACVRDHSWPEEQELDAQLTVDAKFLLDVIREP